MEFQTLIENRRSVRKYSSHTNVTKEQIQQLVQAALEAPSWKNTETGRYYSFMISSLPVRGAWIEILPWTKRSTP